MFWSHFFKKNQIVFVPKSSIGGFSGFSDLDRRSQGVPRRFFADLLTFSGKKVKIFKKLHPSLSHYAPYPPPPPPPNREPPLDPLTPPSPQPGGKPLPPSLFIQNMSSSDSSAASEDVSDSAPPPPPQEEVVDTPAPEETPEPRPPTPTPPTQQTAPEATELEGEGRTTPPEGETEMQWEPAEDEAFRGFFRLNTPGGVLDKLSMLACRRHGTTPEELTWRPVEDFPAFSAAQSERRHAAFLRRREALFRTLEGDRKGIFEELFNFARSTNKLKLGRMLVGEEGERAVRDKSPAPPDCLLSPVSTCGATSTLASFRHDRTSSNGSVHSKDVNNDDVDRYRMKEMRHVLLERKEEVDRQHLQRKIAARVQQSEHIAAEKAARSEREAAASQRRRNALLQKVHDHAEGVYYQRRIDLQRKSDLRDLHDAHFREEEDKRMKARKETTESRFNIVQARAQTVFNGEASAATAQGESLQQRLRTNAAKRENLALQKEGRLALRRLRDMQKLVAISETEEHARLTEEQRSVTLIESTHATELRLEEHKAVQRRQTQARTASEDARAQRVSQNRSAIADKREQQYDAMVLRKVEKEAYLRRLGQDKEDAQVRRREEAEYRNALTRDNMQRLKRKGEHRALVQRRKIELDNEDKVLRDRALRREAVARDRRKRETDRAKLRVRDEIELMRLAAVSPSEAGNNPEAPPRITERPEGKRHENEIEGSRGGGGDGGTTPAKEAPSLYAVKVVERRGVCV